MHLYCRAKGLSRPRKGSGTHFYQPKDNQQGLFAELVRWRRTVKNVKIIDQPVFILYDINIKRKTSKNKYPISKRDCDLDNIIKALNDGLVEYNIIQDDSLIIGSTEFMNYDDEYDYVSIYIFDAATNDLLRTHLMDKLDLIPEEREDD